MKFATVFLIIAVIAFRLVTGLSGTTEVANFSPLAAIAFCGATFLPLRFATVVPLVSMLITDIVLNLHGGFPIFTFGMLLRYLAFGIIFAIGLHYRPSRTRGAYNWKLFGGAILGTLIFYVISNTGAWLTQPGYAKTLAGWWQSQTLGLPGPFPPTIFFLRNSLVGDLFFTGMFVASFAFAKKQFTYPASGEEFAATR